MKESLYDEHTCMVIKSFRDPFTKSMRKKKKQYIKHKVSMSEEKLIVKTFQQQPFANNQEALVTYALYFLLYLQVSSKRYYTKSNSGETF